MPNADKRFASRQQRRLRFQTLETRRLLAVDILDLQNIDRPEDVNANGVVTPADALIVINRVLTGPREFQGVRTKLWYCDVNGDGDVSALDALRVINRLAVASNQGLEHPPQALDFEVRSLTGLGNNLAAPMLGTAHSPFRRIVAADYADGVDDPAGAQRPSAREVSNAVSSQSEPMLNDRAMSDLVWQWGQFIDHDIDLTAEGADEPFAIEVPMGDPFFDPQRTGQQVIDLMRSDVAEDTGVDADNCAEQLNEISSFIDGSMIYGSDVERAEALRSFQGGRLRTSVGDLLPFNSEGFDNAGGAGDTLFLAGDVRANEQVGLTAMHTLWVREHNRIADAIAAKDSSLCDEAVFQLAREIVIGQLQAITFNEYLPTLLGGDAIAAYEGYDQNVDPSISNLFATAAFRYGHTTLSGELPRVDSAGNEIEAGHLSLRDAFFNPDAIGEQGIDSILMGMAGNVSQEIDTRLVDDVRNFLFGPPGSGGFDLASLNIQRGRDHGLPDYNSVRKQLGLTTAESFADITSQPELQAQLQEVYGNVDDVDVWVGALAEDHVHGGSVGELTRTVLVDQFTALRDGDRFWYQRNFVGEQLREIDGTRLSDVIERNTTAAKVQDNVFIVPDVGVKEL